MNYWHCFPVLLAWMTWFKGGHASGIINMQLWPSEKVRPGTSVVVSCEVDTEKSKFTLLWLRHQGSMTSRLGSGDVLDRYVDANRYQLRRLTTGARENYTMTIQDTMFEDTSTIECTLDGADIRESQRRKIVVCDDTHSDSCGCLHTEGFNFPGCFTEPETVDEARSRYRGTVIGLAVCFVIVVIYAILVTILMSRECVTKLYARRQKLLQKPGRKAKANGRISHPYQHAEELTIDPNEAPSEAPSDGVFGAPSDGVYGAADPSQVRIRGRRYTEQTHVNPAFAGDAPRPEPRQGYGGPAQYTDRPDPYSSAGPKDAVVEHHPPPPPHPAGASTNVAPTLEVHAPQPRPVTPNSGARPKQPVTSYADSMGYPAQTPTKPPSSPGNYPPRTPDRGYPSTGSYPGDARSRGASNSRANGYLPGSDVKGQQHPGTPSARSTHALSPPSTPYGGPVTPRSVYSEGTASSPHWDTNVPDRGAYTDVPCDKYNAGAPYRPDGHHKEPRKLDFTGTNGNVMHNNNNSDAFINKSDTVV